MCALEGYLSNSETERYAGCIDQNWTLDRLVPNSVVMPSAQSPAFHPGLWILFLLHLGHFTWYSIWSMPLTLKISQLTPYLFRHELLLLHRIGRLQLRTDVQTSIELGEQRIPDLIYVISDDDDPYFIGCGDWDSNLTIVQSIRDNQPLTIVPFL